MNVTVFNYELLEALDDLFEEIWSELDEDA